jgi:hypothetical protein
MSTTTAVDSASLLASALFKRLDANGNGQLDAGEFQSFLKNLISAAGAGGQGIGTAAASPAPRSATADAHAYQPMLGFDYVKLNTLSHTSPKYVFARATQDVNLPWDRASRSAGLQQIADYVKQQGYPNAAVTGKDSIDFGDGAGSIDVLTSDGAWWWGPKG